MANTLVFTLASLHKAPVPDAAGSWEYATATVTQQGGTLQGILSATKRQNTSPLAVPGVMLTATLMFTTADGRVANLTLQGVADLATKNEAGSVSSASTELADQIGSTFYFEAATLTLTITPSARIPAYAVPGAHEGGRLTV